MIICSFHFNYFLAFFAHYVNIKTIKTPFQVIPCWNSKIKLLSDKLLVLVLISFLIIKTILTSRDVKKFIQCECKKWGLSYNHTQNFFFQIVLSLACAALAAPLEDTDEVKAAKATFQAAFDAAEKGEHAALAPAPVAEAYLADSPDVALVKANFINQYNAIDAALAQPLWAYNSIYPYAAYSAPVVYNAPAVVSTTNVVSAPAVVSAPTGYVASPYWPGYYGLQYAVPVEAVAAPVEAAAAPVEATAAPEATSEAAPAVDATPVTEEAVDPRIEDPAPVADDGSSSSSSSSEEDDATTAKSS